MPEEREGDGDRHASLEPGSKPAVDGEENVALRLVAVEHRASEGVGEDDADAGRGEGEQDGGVLSCGERSRVAADWRQEVWRRQKVAEARGVAEARWGAFALAHREDNGDGRVVSSEGEQSHACAAAPRTRRGRVESRPVR